MYPVKNELVRLQKDYEYKDGLLVEERFRTQALEREIVQERTQLNNVINRVQSSEATFKDSFWRIQEDIKGKFEDGSSKIER